MCESVEEIEALPPISIVHKPGSRVNRNPIVPHVRNLKAPALACWLALTLWQMLDLDAFWGQRLPALRKCTRWDLVLFVLAAYRLIAPGSEWRLHRSWYGRTALSDLLGADASLADPHVLYGCHDRLLAHKQALFDHLMGRWRDCDLFSASFEVLLYDLTSTYFQADPPLEDDDKRRHGYSRDHVPDCVQIVIALIVTPDGLPLAYEVMPGNTNDSTTLRGFLARIVDFCCQI